MFGQEEKCWNKRISILTRHVGGESEVGEKPAAEGELTLPGGHAQVQLLLQQLLHLTSRQRYLSWIRSFKKSQEDGPQQMMKDERKNACLYCTYEWMLKIVNDKKSWHNAIKLLTFKKSRKIPRCFYLPDT